MIESPPENICCRVLFISPRLVGRKYMIYVLVIITERIWMPLQYQILQEHLLNDDTMHGNKLMLLLSYFYTINLEYRKTAPMTYFCFIENSIFSKHIWLKKFKGTFHWKNKKCYVFWKISSMISLYAMVTIFEVSYIKISL